MQTIDPLISVFVAIILAIFCLSLFLKEFKQPYIVGYIIAGFLLGPNVLGHKLSVGNQTEILARMGNMGIILLLFFVGLELSSTRLLKNWIISISGTVLQIIISVAFVWVFSFIFEWDFHKVLLFGFIISLSSTAVVIKLLQEWGELNTAVGQDVIGILLVQDILIVPMLIIISLTTGHKIDWHIIVLQIIGGAIMIFLIIWLVKRGKIDVHFLKKLSRDNESKIFLSLILCFGMATLAGIFNLSPALGAFLGGMLVASIKETQWVYNNLLPLRTIFIAFFFVSIGMLLHPIFILNYFWQIISLTIIIILVNTFINAAILKALGESWRGGIYGGSLLSQIGEFSFILSSFGYQEKIISTVNYQVINSTIALALLISPIWILLIRKVINRATLKLKHISKAD